MSRMAIVHFVNYKRGTQTEQKMKQMDCIREFWTDCMRWWNWEK